MVKECYQVPPLGSDVELLWVISRHLWDTEKRAHAVSIFLALFSFSLKQKMIASQQAFSSKPLHQTCQHLQNGIKSAP